MASLDSLRLKSYTYSFVFAKSLCNDIGTLLTLVYLCSGVAWPEPVSPSPSLTDSWRSNTPSPPLSEGGYAPSCVDEGFIDEEFEDIPKKKKVCNSFFV